MVVSTSLGFLASVQTPLHSMGGVWINSVQQKRKFDRVCLTFFELNLGSTHGAPSESDVAPVSLQSWTNSITIGIWKVRRLNQAILSEEKNTIQLRSLVVQFIPRIKSAYQFFFTIYVKMTIKRRTKASTSRILKSLTCPSVRLFTVPLFFSLPPKPPPPPR